MSVNLSNPLPLFSCDEFCRLPILYVGSLSFCTRGPGEYMTCIPVILNIMLFIIFLHVNENPPIFNEKSSSFSCFTEKIANVDNLKKQKQKKTGLFVCWLHVRIHSWPRFDSLIINYASYSSYYVINYFKPFFLFLTWVTHSMYNWIINWKTLTIYIVQKSKKKAKI